MEMYSVVASDGQVYGPVDLGTISGWISEGRVTATTTLLDEFGGRFKAADIPAFSQLISIKPPVAPAHGFGPHHVTSGPQGQVSVQVNNFRGPDPNASMPNDFQPQKSKIAAFLLAFFIGTLGIHQFYLGKNGLGAAMLIITVVTCGWGAIVTGIWALIDAIVIITGGCRDSLGRELI